MTATLELDGIPVAVETAGPPRQARLTVEVDGSLSLRAAQDVSDHELAAFLTSKRRWVYEKLAIKEALAAPPVVKEIVNGEGFTYLGRNYRLRLVDEGDQVSLQQGRLALPRSLLPTASQALQAWYARCGLDWLRPRMVSWATRLRVSPTGLAIGDLGPKWGASTPDGRIRIHWATMQLPPRLVEYNLVHELTHLREPNHGQAFWKVLTRALPDAQVRKQELATIGASLWFGLVN